MCDSAISVLVVETHPLMREALCAAINSEPGFTVIAQLDGNTDAVSAAIALQPALILMALGNPGWADLQTLHALRQAFPTIPILALTANEVLNQEQAALDLGASEVLTKAAPRCDLLQVLHAQVTKKEAAKKHSNDFCHNNE